LVQHCCSQPNRHMTSMAASSVEDLMAVRLRDLVLRFPCSVIEGVRVSVLCGVYRDRYPEDPILDVCSVCSVVTSLIADAIEFEEASDHSGEGIIRLRDDVALKPGVDGQLACWPALVQRLVEIIRMHGVPQHLGELPCAGAVDMGKEVGSSDKSADSTEDVGVLLAQLKPLLRRHWDVAFDERALGFFSERGTYISVKKMKHLLAELMRWQSRRQSWACAAGMRSTVDAALATPLKLCASRTHNDMVLCCPAAGGTALVAPLGLPAACAQLAEPMRPCRRANQRLEGSGGSSPPNLSSIMNEAPHCRSASVKAGENSPKRLGCDTQRMDAHEKENRRLRIENAELKKRLRFDSEFMHKQIRRLRIENAELKKRVFFTNRHLPAGGVLPELPVRPVWVSASATVLTPVVANPSGGQQRLQATEPTTAGTCMATMGTAMPASGQMSPVQGTITPIQTGFCLVPWTPGVLTPTSPQWPMGQLVAVPLGAQGAATIVSPPYSDLSHQEQLLPHSLLASDWPSAIVSETMSPDHPPGDFRDAAESAGVDATAQFQGPDDRWVCIPSGIVERHKAQFEAPGCQTSNASIGGDDCEAVHIELSAVDRAVVWTNDEQSAPSSRSRSDIAEGGSRERAQSL